jgi:hypothetical protein
MLHEENARDYLCLRRPRSEDGAAFVTQSDRTAIVDWLYSIVDAYRFDLGLVAVAMGMVDRFLSKPSDLAQDALRDRHRFQLVAIAALSIGLETEPQIPSASALLAAATRPLYSVAEIKDAAARLREGLASHLHAPTSLQLAEHVLSLALPGVPLAESRWSCVLDDVRFQLEYAVRDYFFTLARPRTAAVAAVLNAVDHVTGPERRALLRDLPPLVEAHCPSLPDLVAAKHRLRVVMGRDCFEDDTTAMSDEILGSLGDATGGRTFPGFSLASCA